MNKVGSLSELLANFSVFLLEKYQEEKDRVKIAEVMEAFQDRGFAVILFFFALPMALPIPVPPGINVLLASPLILLSAQMMIGQRDIWLPKKVKDKSFSVRRMCAMLDKAVPWVRKIEYFVKPRFEFLTHGLSRNLIGLASLIMALTICVPLPMTNTAPSFGIACMAIGIVMKDGLAVLAGAIMGLLWIALLIFIGEAGIRLLIESFS